MFSALLDLVEDLDTVNDFFKVDVTTRGEVKTELVQPHVLASYLGFVKVTNYILT